MSEKKKNQTYLKFSEDFCCLPGDVSNEVPTLAVAVLAAASLNTETVCVDAMCPVLESPATSVGLIAATLSASACLSSRMTMLPD